MINGNDEAVTSAEWQQERDRRLLQNLIGGTSMTEHEDVKAARITRASIKKGREALGWSVDRLADNACVNMHRVLRVEDGTLQDEGLRTRLIQILKDRGVDFRDDEVFGPNSESALREIVLSSDDLSRLKAFETFGTVGAEMPASEASYFQRTDLGKHRFVELGSISQTIAFPSGPDHRTLGYMMARITARGEAWLKLREVFANG